LTLCTQDWERLSHCIAPTLRIDYRSFLNKIWPALPSAEYLSMISSPLVLGDPLLRTQHFIGQSKWEKVSEEEVVGWHQMRVPHQRYTGEPVALNDGLGEVKLKGHAHGVNKHWYRKVEGVWKFAGLAPVIRWGEFEFDRIFAMGREEHGEVAPVEGGDVTIKEEDVSLGLRGQEAAMAPVDSGDVDVGMGGQLGISQTNGLDVNAAVKSFQEDIKVHGSHAFAAVDKAPVMASVASVPGDSPTTDAGFNSSAAKVKEEQKAQTLDQMLREGVFTLG